MAPMPKAINTMLAAIPPYWKSFLMALHPFSQLRSLVAEISLGE